LSTDLVNQQKLFSIAKPGDLTFTWVAEAPKYRNDFYEYIWQRQTEYPGYEKAVVSAFKNANGSINVIVIFNTTSETQFGRESTRLFEEYYKQRKILLRVSVNAVDNPPSIETEFIASIYTICTCLSADTVSFLDAVSDRLSHLVRCSSNMFETRYHHLLNSEHTDLLGKTETIWVQAPLPVPFG
jgi:hypothetical protein